MEAFDQLMEVVRALRAPDGCPWDRAQTHESLKAPCIEEAAEVLAGINLLKRTGDPENLKEELGDLLLQVVMHAVIAEEEGLFTMEDVARGISDKMIRRHPHVFGEKQETDAGTVLQQWDEIKRREKQAKAGNPRAQEELFAAFDEAERLIGQARERKERDRQ